MPPSSPQREADTTISVLDTLGISRRLKEVGFTDMQAEATTAVLLAAKSSGDRSGRV